LEGFGGAYLGNAGLRRAGHSEGELAGKMACGGGEKMGSRDPGGPGALFIGEI